MKKTNAMSKPELEFIELDMLDVITASSMKPAGNGGKNEEPDYSGVYNDLNGGVAGQPIQ